MYLVSLVSPARHIKLIGTTLVLVRYVWACAHVVINDIVIVTSRFIVITTRQVLPFNFILSL